MYAALSSNCYHGLENDGRNLTFVLCCLIMCTRGISHPIDIRGCQILRKVCQYPFPILSRVNYIFLSILSDCPNEAFCFSERIYFKHATKSRFSEEQKKIMTEWMLKNRRYPYLTEADKRKLARRTGLSAKQVANWVKHARTKGIRKPKVSMGIVEIHSTTRSINSARIQYNT